MDVRICASQQPFDAVINWLRNREVWWYSLRGPECYYLGTANTLDDFNNHLSSYGFAPVGYGRGSKRMSKPEMAKLPF